MKEDRKTIFEQQFDYYYSGLVVYADRFTGSRQVSEDLVHDIFVSVWNTEINIENMKGYLFSSAKNKALNYLKNLKIRSEYQNKVLEKGDISDSIPWDYYVEKELAERIEQAVAKLPDRVRKVFIMSRFEGRSITEIGAELDISPRTVEKHIEVATKLLKTELKDYLPLVLTYWMFGGY